MCPLEAGPTCSGEKEKVFKEGRFLDFWLNYWVEWCCHLHGERLKLRDKSGVFGQQICRRYLSVNVKQAFGFIDLQEFRGRERAELIHPEHFRHREDTQSPQTM